MTTPKEQYVPAIELSLVGYLHSTDIVYFPGVLMSRALWEECKLLGISMPAAVVDKILAEMRATEET